MIATEVRERPILFSGAMIRAILEDRKGQTRRTRSLDVFNTAPIECWEVAGQGVGGGMRNQDYLAVFYNNITGQSITVRSPYGRPGDRLWVRETWVNNFGQILYRADCYPDSFEYGAKGWKPSIHMPRALSRITLENVAVRVERLRDISEEDARTEGVNREFRTVVMRPDGGPDYHIPLMRSALPLSSLQLFLKWLSSFHLCSSPARAPGLSHRSTRAFYLSICLKETTQTQGELPHGCFGLIRSHRLANPPR